MKSSAVMRAPGLPPEEDVAQNLVPACECRRFSHVADERSMEMCECVIDIVAALFNVSSKELRRPGRSSTAISRVRQIGMYVAHVVLRLTMSEVGRGFSRDRTTVQHACHLIEDLREDADFDSILSLTERVTAAAFRNREFR